MEEHKIGSYCFSNSALFQTALTHSSYKNEHRDSVSEDNERLEYLGDAVLELVTSHLLFTRFPDLPEGEMTKQRAALVCEAALATRARALGLSDLLLLGIGEEKTGGREKDSLLSDALEAVIAAIYLDGGFSSAFAFVEEEILLPQLSRDLHTDYKTGLQEWAQERGLLPRYEITEQEDAGADARFLALAFIDEKQIAQGFGKTKKAATMQAAKAALAILRDGKDS